MTSSLSVFDGVVKLAFESSLEWKISSPCGVISVTGNASNSSSVVMSCTVQVTSIPSVTAGSMTTWLSCLKAKSTASLISFREFTLVTPTHPLPLLGFTTHGKPHCFCTLSKNSSVASLFPSNRIDFTTGKPSSFSCLLHSDLLKQVLVSSTPEKVKGIPALSKNACSSPLSASLPLGRRSTTSGFTLFLPTIDINFSLSNVPVLSSQCSFHGPFPTSSTHVSNFPSPSIIFATLSPSFRLSSCCWVSWLPTTTARSRFAASRSPSITIEKSDCSLVEVNQAIK